MCRYLDGRTGTRLYNIWRGIKKRCNDTENAKYGGRGIGYCEQWEDYPTFRAWALGAGYADDLTIERDDNDGDYSPANCSWITMGQQARNRRNSHRITLGGETHSLAEWCERQRLPYARVCARINKLRWPPARALQIRGHA